MVRIAQGSATVSMITGVGLMSAVIGDGVELDLSSAVHLPRDRVWLHHVVVDERQRLLGGTTPERLHGKETLKTWSVLLTAIAVLGLVQTLIFSKILPLKQEAKPAEKAALVVQQN